jgi:hypothetical protein
MGIVTYCTTCEQNISNCECMVRSINAEDINIGNGYVGYIIAKPVHETWDCKHIHKEGEGCSLNNNCKFPHCKHLQ